MLIILLLFSLRAEAADCRGDLANVPSVQSQIEKISYTPEGVLRAYLMTTMQFPLFRAPTNLVMSALFLSGRADLETFRKAETDPTLMHKAFRMAEVAHSKINLPLTVSYKEVANQFRSFIYHTIEPYGPTFILLQLLHEEEFPEEWCFWANDRVIKELYSDALYQPAIAKGKIYGEAIIYLLFSKKMAAIAQQYRNDLRLEFPENQNSESERTQKFVAYYTNEIENYLVGELDRLFPELAVSDVCQIKTSTYFIRHMMRDWRH